MGCDVGCVVTGDVGWDVGTFVGATVGCVVGPVVGPTVAGVVGNVEGWPFGWPGAVARAPEVVPGTMLVTAVPLPPEQPAKLIAAAIPSKVKKRARIQKLLRAQPYPSKSARTRSARKRT